MHEYHVTSNYHRWRLDRFLAYLWPEFSRTRIQQLIRQGYVFQKFSINDQVIQDPNHRLNEGEQYYVTSPPSPEESPLVPQEMALGIYHEDEDVVVLEKPAGLVVHPGAGIKSPTLVHGLLAHCQNSLSGIAGIKKPGIVHRLDKDTSGIMVIAKTDQAHHHLSHQFASRSLEKVYWAFVRQRPQPPAGRIETSIGRHPHHRTKMAVLQGKGRFALTSYHTLETSSQASLLECQLHTGRTHQIRVHCAYIGHPLLGDTLYGGPPCFPRQALHAKKLTFCHPRTCQKMSFESPLPPDLQELYLQLFEEQENT